MAILIQMSCLIWTNLSSDAAGHNIFGVEQDDNTGVKGLDRPGSILSGTEWLISWPLIKADQKVKAMTNFAFAA